MKKYLVSISAVILFVSAAAFGQTPDTGIPVSDCPVDKVCISTQAAQKAVNDAAKVKALEEESKAKDQAIADIKALLETARIEYAATKGENSALKQNAVSDRQIIEVLLKSSKKRCLPFSVCLF